MNSTSLTIRSIIDVQINLTCTALKRLAVPFTAKGRDRCPEGWRMTLRNHEACYQVLRNSLHEKQGTVSPSHRDRHRIPKADGAGYDWAVPYTQLRHRSLASNPCDAKTQSAKWIVATHSDAWYKHQRRIGTGSKLSSPVEHLRETNIKQKNIKVGIALRPKVDLTCIKKYVNKIDWHKEYHVFTVLFSILFLTLSFLQTCI